MIHGRFVQHCFFASSSSSVFENSQVKRVILLPRPPPPPESAAFKSYFGFMFFVFLLFPLCRFPLVTSGLQLASFGGYLFFVFQLDPDASFSCPPYLPNPENPASFIHTRRLPPSVPFLFFLFHDALYPPFSQEAQFASTHGVSPQKVRAGGAHVAPKPTRSTSR